MNKFKTNTLIQAFTLAIILTKHFSKISLHLMVVLFFNNKLLNYLNLKRMASMLKSTFVGKWNLSFLL
jgi:hypothetical protein